MQFEGCPPCNPQPWRRGRRGRGRIVDGESSWGPSGAQPITSCLWRCALTLRGWRLVFVRGLSEFHSLAQFVRCACNRSCRIGAICRIVMTSSALARHRDMYVWPTIPNECFTAWNPQMSFRSQLALGMATPSRRTGSRTMSSFMRYVQYSSFWSCSELTHALTRTARNLLDQKPRLRYTPRQHSVQQFGAANDCSRIRWIHVYPKHVWPEHHSQIVRCHKNTSAHNIHENDASERLGYTSGRSGV